MSLQELPRFCAVKRHVAVPDTDCSRSTDETNWPPQDFIYIRATCWYT